MNIDELITQLDCYEEYLNRATRCLSPEDGGFSPTPGTFTTAQHLAHIAHTVDWFLEGAFRPEGFNMDFESHDRALAEVKTLETAREWVARSFEEARKALREQGMEGLSVPLPEGPVIGGAPRFAIVGAIGEHTAHHRGALSVYARLCKREPAMPYMDL